MMLQIILLTTLSMACAKLGKMEPFIVGGQEAPISKWPFITFISVSSGHEQISACGGSLLSAQTVLTAAHCLDDVTENKRLFRSRSVRFSIFMGHSSFAKSTMVRRVIDYETHQNYEPEHEDVRSDIGVMFLYNPVTFGRNVKKVILFDRRFNPRRDQKLLVAGWGRFDTGDDVRISPRLKDVGLVSISASDCKYRHPFIEDITSVVCAEASHEFAYSGDSGGPMVKLDSRYQLGIVSFRNEETGVTVFTSVPEYYEWINQTNFKLFKKYCMK